MTKRLNLWLLFLILILGLPYYWLFIDDRSGLVEPYPLTVKDLRRLAESQPGSRPISIRYEVIGQRAIPRTLIAAGQGFKMQSLTARAYRLEIEDGSSIMIDTGMTRDAATRLEFDSYNAIAQALIEKELKKASLVVTLSNGVLHSGGLTRVGPAQPAEQRPDASKCPGARALAPGVVEIPVCGKVNSPRMVYVRLDGGAEYLFAGDIAPFKATLDWNAGPSRLVNDFHLWQDRLEIHRWLLTISRLKEQAPRLIVIVGHSPLPIEDMSRGFRPTGAR